MTLQNVDPLATPPREVARGKELLGLNNMNRRFVTKKGGETKKSKKTGWNFPVMDPLSLAHPGKIRPWGEPLTPMNSYKFPIKILSKSDQHPINSSTGFR